MKQMTFAMGAVLMLLSFATLACAQKGADQGADKVVNQGAGPDPINDESLVEKTSTQGEPVDTDKVKSTEPVADLSADTQAETEPQKTEPSDGAALRKIVLAGGCFWCVEAVYEQLDGVVDVESGYSGGDAFTANYRAVTTGKTSHAEAVRITYDASKITLGTLLKVFFTTAHDPTTLNRQGADVGPQYRSAIFYETDKQKQIAQDYIKQLNEAKYHASPIVTTLEPLEVFYPAETYHQDYAQNNPNDRYIQGVSQPKVDKTREKHKDLLK